MRPRFALAAGEVHVWLAHLKLPADLLDSLQRTLSRDELDRAARFRFEHDRQRFVASRGLVRDLLGRYLARDPASLTFEHNPYGKPSLPAEMFQALRFNLSHSHEFALIAVSRDRELGVDLERLRPDLPLEIADRYFSPHELTELQGVAERLRPTAFLNCWTRKEAYIKARGRGLSLPLESFDVSLVPGEPAALLTVRDAPSEVSRWSLRALPAPVGYIAALVVEGPSWDLRLRRWTPDDGR